MHPPGVQQMPQKTMMDGEGRHQLLYTYVKCSLWGERGGWGDLVISK